jgi:RNA polymerase sigma factor for flagellar operon FliA
LAGTEPSAYDTLAWRQMCRELDQRVTRLPEKVAFVIDQHYRRDVPFQQIAILLGLSKGRVSQLHAQGLDLLRKQMARLR